MVAIIRSLRYFIKQWMVTCFVLIGMWALCPITPASWIPQCLWSLCVFISRNWSQSITRGAWCYSVVESNWSEPKCVSHHQMAFIVKETLIKNFQKGKNGFCFENQFWTGFRLFQNNELFHLSKWKLINTVREDKVQITDRGGGGFVSKWLQASFPSYTICMCVWVSV